MLKKLLYSTFLNVGIIVLLYSSVVAYNNQQYGILAGALLAACALIYLKVQVLKQVREINKK